MKPIAYLRKVFILFTISFAPAIALSQTISGTINSYYHITGVNVVPNTITVSSAAGLTPGLKVLIIQMKGASINTANSNTFGNISAINNAGNYEVNYICGISGNNVLLQYQLLRTYDVSGSIQLIPIPQYNSVTVLDTVRADTWNPATGTGGVVVLEAADTIFLNSAIDVSGKGFVGGALLNNANCVWSTNVADYTLPAVPADANTSSSKKGEGIADFITNGDYGRGKQANGGGGGNNHNTGGAGGSNYGIGGNGGLRSGETFFQCHGGSPGVGGLTLSTQGYTIGNNRIFMGGGGGAGHQNNFVGTPGGNGGGIIILIANTIYNGGGKLLANGGNPYNPLCANPLNAEGDGGGGGGAGGTIILQLQQVSNGKLFAEVKGANGSGAGWATNNCTGPGGGGGGGVLWVNNAALLPNIADSLAGGTNGVISPFNSTPACQGQANSATSGGTGATLTGNVIPTASNFICAPLAAEELTSFTGTSTRIGNRLSWSMREVNEIASYELQRSDNRIDYQLIALINNGGKLEMSLIDEQPPVGYSYYRLKLLYKNGRVEYSKIVSLSKNASGIEWLALYPNPAVEQFRISMMAPSQGDVRIKITNQLGQLIQSINYPAKKGFNTLVVPANKLAPGLYFVSLEMNGFRFVKKLVIGSSAH